MQTWLMLSGGCRFFHTEADFEHETAFYQDANLRRTLPQLYRAVPNRDGAVVSQRGYRFPPFIVIERGTSLEEWMNKERSFGSVLNMVHVRPPVPCALAPTRHHMFVYLLLTASLPSQHHVGVPRFMHHLVSVPQPPLL